jgi:hypothetical protein
MTENKLLWRCLGVALLFVGIAAIVLIFTDTADWSAPRREGSNWVGGANTYFRTLTAGVCSFGGIAVLGRSLGKGRQ